MTTLDIRQVGGEELLSTSYPLWNYAFSPSPPSADFPESERANLHYRVDDLNLVAFGADGRAEATVTGHPMRQNVRGAVLPALGVSAVATHPQARRRGHVRALLDALHGRMRESGCAVSTLYPFDPHFYERFGYTALPQSRRVRLLPDGMAALNRLPGPDGEVTLHRIPEVYEELLAVMEEALRQRHGMAMLAHSQLARMRADDRQWVALARHGGRVRGAMTYRTTGHSGAIEHAVPVLLDRAAQQLMVRWLALHVGQFTAFALQLPPGEQPELWFTNATHQDETRTGPGATAPMARVLSVPALAGLPEVGPASVTVRVTGDQLVEGIWTLDGTGGAGLAVRAGGEPTAELSSQGLAGLVFGVLDPEELPWRGYGSVGEEKTAEALRVLFPAARPYVLASF
jgi:predicted acetyltransferase